MGGLNMTEPKVRAREGLGLEVRGERPDIGVRYLHLHAEPLRAPPAPATSSAPLPPKLLWTEPCSAVQPPRRPRRRAGSECSLCLHQASPHHDSWRPAVNKKWSAFCSVTLDVSAYLRRCVSDGEDL